MSSIKKLMCNPPAQAVATTGDAKLAGMFQGAGAAIHHLSSTGTHPQARTEFTHAVLAIEQEYMDKREALELEMRTRLQVQFDWLVEKVDGAAEQQAAAAPAAAEHKQQSQSRRSVSPDPINLTDDREWDR